MDCLDQPLHLEILSSLASNLAKNGGVEDGADISVLTAGLPIDRSHANHNGNTSDDEDDGDDTWDEYELNHAISYAHYVTSLDTSSPYLDHALPRIRELLSGVIANAVPRRDDPSSSTANSDVASSSTQHAVLLEALLKATLWVGWSRTELAAEAGAVIANLLESIQRFMGRALTFSGVVLATIHAVLSHVPLPALPASVVARILTAVTTIGTPDNLAKAVREASASSPAPPLAPAFNTAPHPTTPAGVALLVSEICNILLARVLTPTPEITQSVFVNEHQPASLDSQSSSVWKNQTKALLAEPVEQSFLEADPEGKPALEEAGRLALRWWADLNDNEGDTSPTSGIRNRYSRLTVNDGQAEDEVYLTVAVLHMLNLVSLHNGTANEGQLARLKHLLSENSTVSDARVLQASFICLAIVVRNYPELGASLTHHLRRLLMSPLPALESEVTSSGMELSPTITAASTCLAMCIEMSANDDLVSSTLYSLLGVLSHGTTVGPGAMSVRSLPLNQATLGIPELKSHTSAKRSEQQRQLISTTAVEIVSRLALDTGRDDIIHLSISMLLQRLRGVDIATESAIVTNLVPLALSATDEDLVEVYRAFSQISRSSHPEDPRMSSNAVLSAQTLLAKGLGSRVSTLDGYLSELLSLFADRGVDTQAAHMAATKESNNREKEKKLSAMRPDNERRAADMKASLSALLLPIAEVLAHKDYHPGISPTPECVSQFRNLWILCAVFGLSGSVNRSQLSDHEHDALATIAVKTPPLVLETATDFVGSDLEYNTVLRKDFASSIHHKMRVTLQELIPSTKYTSDIRNMSTPQLTLLIAIHDLEQTRTLRNQPSVMLSYFCNESINKSPPIVGCLSGIANKQTQVFLKALSKDVVVHNLPPNISDQVCKILVLSTHRMKKVREMALSYARSIIETFSALMCDRKIVFTLLEMLTLLRRSCEMQFTDEYSPTHHFKSDKIKLTLELTDDYAARNEITTSLHSVSHRWFTMAISRAPIEVQSTLQSYLKESRDVLLLDSVELGAGVALHFAKAVSRLDRQESIMPQIGGWSSDYSNLLSSVFASKNYYEGELSGARHVLQEGLGQMQKGAPAESTYEVRQAFKQQMADAVAKVPTKEALRATEIRRLLYRAVNVLIASTQLDADILHFLVALPMATFTPLSIAAGVDAWTWLVRQRPDAEVALLGEISNGWLTTVKLGKGMFSTRMNYHDPFVQPLEYAPSDKKVMDAELAKARRLLKPHLLLIQILSSQFQAVKYRAPGIMVSIARLMLRSLDSFRHMSTHPLAREVRFSLLLFGFQVLASTRVETLLELRFRDALYNAAFGWFAVRPQWSFGSNRIQVGAEIKLLQDFATAIQEDQIRADHATTSLPDRAPAWLVPGTTSLQDYIAQHKERVRLLQLLVENEINRLAVWSNPANDRNRALAPSTVVEGAIGAEEWGHLVRKAWKLNPAVAVQMGERFKQVQVHSEITRLVRSNPRRVLGVPEALNFLLGDKLETTSRSLLQWVLVWDPVPPVEALNYFQPRYGNHPILLQYAMRVLEQHPVDLTFFFVPQVVQALRTDALGYVESFIFETSKISQLFCHQIIWNMKANTYKDDNGEEPDSLKPVLDRMVDNIVASLSGPAKEFYEREFGFFGEVTSISGKLKPYIKKTKPEKKAKIDEEMAKIKLEVGVYLPSNPDGVVIDLDRKSGRPLQSHAKAPFMATFKVQKEKIDLDSADLDIEAETDEVAKRSYDVWQSAIFKVGDDCRQDVLALQLIAMFKNVFTQLGLTLYLFPYRVTATAPGCGVIDVVPNATSRDEMGRAQINDLVEYFVDKYGGVDTVAFQKARLNFVQSMAAYSVACYILQIKDRHNGNIMIDAEGHIVHIDFGFLFDIGPGGIKFEAGSFKLNREMVALMGGADSQGYKMFVDLTVKAFLAIRPHADQLVDAVNLMLGTGLPSFKGEGTIHRLRERFALHLNEKAAADFMLGVIHNAHQNMRSDLYDGFQKLQNGIPY
ncbi:Phosphatidylinositol 4-kinase stt4 [Vanrija albida]|uniref:1-phosphatidylinositol 4-kinase n=1 Tax=Vanrija albida TaxID=181172 RepID=A0ABR3QDK2_9TREE